MSSNYTKEPAPLIGKRKREEFEEDSQMKQDETVQPSKRAVKQQKLSKKPKSKVSVFWFRRDLRLEDNTGLHAALKSKYPVLPLFIFDTAILGELQFKKDARVEFIHQHICRLQAELKPFQCHILIKHSTVQAAFAQVLNDYDVQAVYTNRDYEPQAKLRDESVGKQLKEFNKNIEFKTYKDQVIFEAEETNKDDGLPYKVFTPYSKKWLGILKASNYASAPSETLQGNYFKNLSGNGAEDIEHTPSLEGLGFEKAGIPFPPIELNEKIVKHYDKTRDIPSIEGTTRMSVHLRFGTVSIRSLVRRAKGLNDTYLNELIWRDFYMMILDQFPESATNNFKPAYDKVIWRNNVKEFQAWCDGKTGYYMVDAGMRQLNETGYMHNRVRMIVSSFLTKHLLIDWKWGERYFAQKLLDFDLAANVGGWQWAAGTGTDAQPYFRIFNPESQQSKFDPDHKYIKRWIKELNTKDYPKPIVDHKVARERCLSVFKAAVGKKDED